MSFFFQPLYSCVSGLQHEDYHTPNMQIFLLGTFAKLPLKLSTFLLGYTETCLEKTFFFFFFSSSPPSIYWRYFFTMDISQGNKFEHRMFLRNSFALLCTFEMHISLIIELFRGKHLSKTSNTFWRCLLHLGRPIQTTEKVNRRPQFSSILSNETIICGFHYNFTLKFIILCLFISII